MAAPVRNRSLGSLSGDPAIDQRLRAALDRLVDLAAPIDGLDALLLGGSLARGEGAGHRGADGEPVVDSDIEAYLVGRDRSLRRQASLLSASATSATGVEVSLAWLHPDRLRHGRARNLSFRPARTILAYDLGASARTLLGAPPAIRPVDPATIPIAEGLRLLLNRCVEAAPAVGGPAWPRWQDKLLTAAGDALLIADGAYAGGYAERAAAVARESADWIASGRIPPASDGLIAAAYGRRLGTTAGATAPGTSAGTVPAATLAAIVASVATGLVRTDFGVELAVADFAAGCPPLARRSATYARYLPPAGPARHYDAAVTAIRAGSRLGWRRWPAALAGRSAILQVLACGLPILLARLGGTDGAAPTELLAGARRAARTVGLDLPDDAAAAATRLESAWRRIS
ncbi:MAG TPA: hypothetical protein VGI98_00090 [Candidatus Limnocylindrales bacterium]